MSETPPTLAGNSFNYDNTFQLYVHFASLNEYQSSSWGKYASEIIPLDNQIKITVGDAGFATFSNFCSNPDNLSAYYIDFSEAENIEAYKAKVEGNTVILTKTDKVLAGEGVLLRSLKETDEATTEWLPIVYGTTDKTDDNDFVGVKQQQLSKQQTAT